MTISSVSVLGLGYIGLPTAALLAGSGYRVSGTDVNQDIIATVNRGEVHIVEPGLEEIVKTHVSMGELRAFDKVQRSDVYFICVPTPFIHDGVRAKPDLSFVITAAEQIAQVLEPGNIVILESTCPVGATDAVFRTLINGGAPAHECDIAYCPERVLPGQIMRELVENDRIVGGLTEQSTSRVVNFYKTFVRGEVHGTDAKTAEMCKLTENSYRDVNIAFANELSLIADSNGVDVWRVIELANRHPRVNILKPGIGVGGHCIAVDPWFLVDSAPESSKLIAQARHVNDMKPSWVVNKIEKELKGRFKGDLATLTIGCLGLAFKPNIDDLRASPAVEVVEQLIGRGHSVLAVEPHIAEHPTLPICDFDVALKRADLMVILVAHDLFLNGSLASALADIEVLDFCGIYNNC